MSDIGGKGGERSVVPRWRSFLNVPSAEIVPINRFPLHEPIRSSEFAALIKIWRSGKKVEDAIDILDAGIACGSRQLAVEGAKAIQSFGEQFVQQPIWRRAASILGTPIGHRQFASVPVEEEQVSNIYIKIGRLKQDLREQQRNPLAHLEIARLYSRLAHFEKAHDHIRISVALAPNDRLVLRSAIRFFTMINEHREGLDIVWNSESIKYDPWIQSAELAAAVQGNEKTKYAKINAKKISRNSISSIETSELSTGWATFQSGRGMSTKNAIKMLKRSINLSTENALAQAIWFAAVSGKKVADVFPHLKIDHNAHEALSLTLSDREEYGDALREAVFWFVDQPFQARSAIQICYLSFVHLKKYEVTVKFAKMGQVMHPVDWNICNFFCLASAKLGNFEEANRGLHKFEQICDSPESRIFLAAAKGMVEIEKGNSQIGLNNYLESMRLARSADRPDLSVNAVIYLLESAVTHRLVDSHAAQSVITKIDKVIKKLHPASQKSIGEIWRATRPTIDRELELLDVIAPVLKLGSVDEFIDRWDET